MDRQAYGWTSTDAPECAGYVLPAVVDLLAGHPIRQLLDLGCGNGLMATELAAQADVEVIGVDADAEGVALARERVEGSANGSRVRFAVVDGEGDPADVVARFGAVDAVVSTEVIEHVFYPRRFVAFARGVLRPGGVLVISTPYHGYLKNLVLSVLGLWDRHADPLWDGGHIKFWSRRTLVALLQEQGFVVTGFRGVGRVPWLWKSMVVRAVLPSSEQGSIGRSEDAN